MANATKPLTVAVLGTGIMGRAMALRLLGAGLAVRVWNRSTDKAAPLAKQGAVVASTGADATSGADVVITMLSDGPAVEQAMDGPRGGLAGSKPGQIWLQTSTVGVAACDRLATLAAPADLTFVDAPVLGTRQPAERGELIVLASGPPSAEQRLRPITDAIAKKVFWLGQAGQGQRMKLVANAWVIGLLGALGESIALAEALTLDPARFLEIIKGGPLDVGYAHVKGRAMIDRDYAPSFPLHLAHKDAGLIQEAARTQGRTLPVTQAIEALLARAQQDGHGDDDFAALYEALSAPPRAP
jgi:3-hydroxyisobutyrate dehydrogenase